MRKKVKKNKGASCLLSSVIIANNCLGRPRNRGTHAPCHVGLFLPLHEEQLYTQRPVSLMDVSTSQVPELTKLPGDVSDHAFIEPVKKINEGHDVDHFLSSKAYKDIVTWLLMLNASMFPRTSEDGAVILRWPSGGSPKDVSPIVSNLRDLIREADEMMATFPPDTGPRRFGNIAFRDWHAGLEARADALLTKHLPENLQVSNSHGVQAIVEIKAYFLGSWGSAQRLDYGTGHELSFLAFLACLWKVGAFARQPDGKEERAIVLYVIHPYACALPTAGGASH